MFADSAGPVLSKEEEVALRDMILSMVDEPLVLVVKLADRRAPLAAQALMQTPIRMAQPSRASKQAAGVLVSVLFALGDSQDNSLRGGDALWFLCGSFTTHKSPQ